MGTRPKAVMPNLHSSGQQVQPAFGGECQLYMRFGENVNPNSRDFHSTTIAAKRSCLHLGVMINQLLLGSADYRETQD